MEVLQNRTDSFKPKRVKNPAKPSSSVSVKWPHSQKFIATPEVLAEAGFYFSPSYDDRDNVSCFFCDKQLSNWEVDDDPFDIHWDKCGTSCCWAIVRCRLRADLDAQMRFVSTEKTRLPTSKHMERARLETFSFGDGWIHDKTPNHSANSREMACAGFVYTPQHPGDDLATCLYCGVSLGGWDATDDPMEEHRKRNNKTRRPCAFFSTQELATATKPPSKLQTKPQSKSRSQSRSQQKDTILPTKAYDGELEDESETDPSTVPSAKQLPKGRSVSGSARSAAKPTVVSGKAPKKHTRSHSRSGLKEVTEGNENVEGGEEFEVAPARASRTTSNKGKSRSRSKSVSRAKADTNEDEEEIDDEVVERKVSKTKSKAKEAYIEEDGGVEVKVLKKSTRAKSKGRVLAADEVRVAEDEKVEGVKNLKKSTRGREKPGAGSTEEVKTIKEDEVVGTTAAKAPAPVTRKASRTKAKPVIILDDDDDDEAADTSISVVEGKSIVSSSSSNTRSTSTTKLVSNIRNQDELGDILEEPKDADADGIEEEHRADETLASNPQGQEDQPHEEPPRTPPRPTVVNPCDSRIDDPLPSAPPPTSIFPPLSKIPFTPIHNLSEAELDMTVEEWIRYQMEVEYDKFRRDGERELGRFRKKAEEVRAAIEGL